MDSNSNNGRVFEDFVPPHTMVREPATHTLAVDLSAAGYKKEHIRVQMVHSHRRLVVRGERPVAGNRWSRFRLELRVPDGCDAKAIHARFENGVVRVTMPGAAPEPVQVQANAAAARQDQEQDPSQPAKPAAAAPASSVQDQKGGADDGAARQQDGEEGEKKDNEAMQKQEMRQRVMSSAKDGGGHDDDAGGEEGEVMEAASPSRQGFGFLHDRRMATTVLGVVLVLISFGIYVRYSLWP